MGIREAIIMAALVTVSAGAGCSAVHSDAVRELIKREGSKINAAQTNIALFQSETEDRIGNMEKSIKDLNVRFKLRRESEAVHSFVFSSYQNISTKKGVDAYAVAYLMGKIYLAEHAGLEKRVSDQFDEDFSALREAAGLLNDSWKALATLHNQIEVYANKSAIASVDPEFIAAIVDQVPSGSKGIKTVLERSRTVNDALEEAATFRFLKGRRLEQSRSLMVDLMELLERVKKD